jgi:hypothetical protein
MTKNNLNPESEWKVRIENNILLSVDWNGVMTELDLSQINRFYVRTTDSGPWFADVWYGIVCDNGKIEIPQGATGENHIHEFTTTLDGYQLDGMNSTENRIFECWLKDKS